MQCNLMIFPQLKNEINLIGNELGSLERELFQITPQWKNLKQEKEKYDTIKQEIIEELKNLLLDSADCNNKMYYFPEYKALPEWIFEEMKVRFNNCCPECEEFLKKYNYVNEKYDNLKNEIQKLETLETDLKNYRDTIYKYFTDIHRSNELIA